MTSAANWVQGARPRTLGAAISPVLVGTAVASRYGDVTWWRVLFCLLLAVALQVGVNYANDYSDGVRGVDTQRRGPVRLTASGLAAPATVKRAALLSFAVGGLLGIVLAAAVDWRLVLVGAASIAAAALYSGGPKPYASSGLGEVMVLVFFGFVATCGSAYVQLVRVPWLAVAAAVPVGLLACAILLVNNLRDVDSDRQVGKRTLAVRVGKARTRRLYRLSIVLSLVVVAALAAKAPGALLALAAAPLAVPPLRIVSSEADPPSLVRALVATGRLQLVLAVLLAAGLAV
ncbi:MAG: 1,4-dihydroxy-2-naphthoate polyprenyltransferase [Actinomycetota bacterium]|nr:1,4-dihydroxy-2-naphthoate polyprenyltransferase [Actinomycetota bacterium]